MYSTTIGTINKVSSMIRTVIIFCSCLIYVKANRSSIIPAESLDTGNSSKMQWAGHAKTVSPEVQSRLVVRRNCSPQTPSSNSLVVFNSERGSC